MSAWLDGYGLDPGPPVLHPRPVLPIQCPKCRSDQVRVRSSDRGTSYLQCVECGYGDGAITWKVTRRLKRVIIEMP